MPRHSVRVFRLPFTKSETPAGVAPKPTEEGGFTVDARTVDEARQIVVERLATYGEEARSLNHTTSGLAAVVYAKKAAS